MGPALGAPLVGAGADLERAGRSLYGEAVRGDDRAVGRQREVAVPGVPGPLRRVHHEEAASLDGEIEIAIGLLHGAGAEVQVSGPGRHVHRRLQGLAEVRTLRGVRRDAFGLVACGLGVGDVGGEPIELLESRP
jgi:hypothetical protein